MSIASGDFVTRLSGGASNADGDASLGGAKSSEVASTSLDQLFDAADAAEALAGDVEYRCVYLHNGNATGTMTDATVHIASNTPLADNNIAIGVGTAAVNATEQTIANESTAPSGVTFSAPTSQGTALALGTLMPGQHKAIWIRRTLDADAENSASQGWSLEYNCETV